ncbi:cob(I)yrinic acid a,c-diamide adenosyltransferase [candidate division WOR-3 bacterium]|nr:cob(I)yrinic acid a,c-diamide adenosyltransferase [candidate division WOR-3 bacterium]
MAKLVRGYFQVYTGNGKGKTTAALGLSIRAAGAGLKVYIGQFLKGLPYSEHLALDKFRGQIFYELFGGREFIDMVSPSKIDYERAEKGFQRSLDAVSSGEYDLVILDEINIAAHFGLLDSKKILDLIEKKPVNMELVFTGRYAPMEFIQRADLVTVMEEVKHYYREGVEARTGIEM